MTDPLRVLLVDDDQDDYLLTRELLFDAFGPQTELAWARTYDEGTATLHRGDHDVCLLDYRLGPRTGLDLLRAAMRADHGKPIILLTGQGEREVDVEAMQAGAADFLPKENLRPEWLERSIRHALERHRDRLALRTLNDELERRVDERTAELEQANNALQAADRRKDEFLATLAHELRNPLAPIANALELLAAHADDPATRDDAVATARRQLAQLVRLIDDLLEVSRISQGKIVLRREQIAVAQVIDQAVEAARPAIDSREQALIVDVPKQPLQLDADALRLAQIVGNLLNNASKFTPNGGRIRVGARVDGDAVEIVVEDNGIGIDPAHRERIFELFAQLDSPPQRGDAGLGIGLTLVSTLVKMHGGTIEANSGGTGQGSQFVVRLPLPSARAQAASDEKPPAKRPVGLANNVPPRRILVVDDNVDSATTLARLLKIARHQVDTAFCGEEALAKAAASHPEVVLLDIGLPDLTGYEVARRLRASNRGRDMMLVALTGWGQESDRRQSAEAGIDHHLLKPVEYASLLKLLSESAHNA